LAFDHSIGRRFFFQFYTARMPLHFQFITFIGALCVTRITDVHKLGTKLDIDPMELLKMINGKVVPTKAIVSGLARELGCDQAYLQKLAAEIKPWTTLVAL
jgi:hypothetical protein